MKVSITVQWYSVQKALDSGMTFIPIIGGRGIGKTYSTLHEFINRDIHFLYLRSTQIEVDLCMTEEGNPFKTLNRDLNKNYIIKSGKIPSIINLKSEKESECVGYAGALSTWSNIKSADFSDITHILWEEFIIPKEKRRFLKNEVDSFFNLYETVNRNRELKGQEAVQVIMLSNAVSLNSPILDAMQLITEIESMLRKEKQVHTIRERGIRIELPKSEISDLKKDTALYRLTKGTQYFSQAIENKFSYDSRYNVKKQDLSEYIPICSYENIYFYRHKSNGNVYASGIRADCPSYNSDTYALFKRNHWLELREKNISGNLYYETFTMKCRLEAVI